MTKKRIKSTDKQPRVYGPGDFAAERGSRLGAVRRAAQEAAGSTTTTTVATTINDGGGSGAATSAPFVTWQGDVSLTGARVLTASAEIAPDVGAAGIVTLTLQDGTIAYARLQDVTAESRLLGRGQGSGSGDVQEITLGAGLTMVGTVLSSAGGGGLVDGDYGDITVSGGGATLNIDNDVVTFAKMQNIATDRLIGRDTAASGDPEELTVGGGLEFTGSGGIQRSALTGDVTAAAGSNATTIPNDTVTYAKMQNISAADRLLGRGNGGGSGDTQEITLGTNLSMSGTTLNATGGGGGITRGEVLGMIALGVL